VKPVVLVVIDGLTPSMFEAAETPIDQAEPVPPEVGDRRASVHERGREMAEQMRRGNSSGS